MNQQEILKLAKQSGLLISSRPEFEEAVKLFGKKLINKVAPKPLTPTQLAYLEALSDWKSLQDLAQQFNCTPQNALKMVRVLEANKLVSKNSWFKRRTGRGAWAFYYKANGGS